MAEYDANDISFPGLVGATLPGTGALAVSFPALAAANVGPAEGSEVIMTASPVTYFFRGWYTVGLSFEYFESDEATNPVPPSGHVLQDVVIVGVRS